MKLLLNELKSLVTGCCKVYYHKDIILTSRRLNYSYYVYSFSIQNFERLEKMISYDIDLIIYHKGIYYKHTKDGVFINLKPSKNIEHRDIIISNISDKNVKYYLLMENII